MEGDLQDFDVPTTIPCHIQESTLNFKAKDQYKNLVNTTGLSVLSYMLLLITVAYLLPLFNITLSTQHGIASIFILCVLTSYFKHKTVRFIYDLLVYSLLSGLLVYLL